MIKRNISQKIIKSAKEYPVILITGPRQSGKTTLVKNIFPPKNYFNLEDLETRDFALRDPKGFLNQVSGQMIIDEVQRAPDLLSQIQVIVDERKKPGQFVLTGSQNLLLLERVSQSLAGRVAIFYLLPFSLAELSREKAAFKDLDKLMFKGFYPRLYDKRINIEEYYTNYIQTYIERDVRLLKNIVDLSAFKRFLSLVAGRCGQILNFTSLAQDCGISQATAKEWLSVLEASFIVFLLPPHYRNFNKRVVKMPKIYFYDTGLVCSLLNISSPEQLSKHYLRGSIFESFIISEFIKHKYNRGQRANIYYWRNKTGQEIDLLFEEGSRLIPMEIKSGQTVTADYFKGLKYYQKLSGLDPKDFYLIYAGEQKQKRAEANVLPWFDLPREINKII